jgi:integrase
MLHDGHGLYLRVAPTGAKSWVYRYKTNGKQHDIGLGSARLRPLAEARDMAIDLERQHRLQGIDPLATRRAKVARPVAVKSFKEVALEWIAAKGRPWSTRHRANVVASLSGHAYPVIGDMPVSAVDTKAIMSVIGPKWSTTPETMSRVRSRIESVLGFAETSGYREPGNNPARWGKHLSNLLPKRADVAPAEKFPALAWEKLPTFLVDLRAKEGLAARALEFTILTAARTGEVIGAKWAEVDEKGAVWTIPAERMKGPVESTACPSQRPRSRSWRHYHATVILSSASCPTTT